MSEKQERIGKFFVTFSVIEEPYVADVLALLRFVPVRVEANYARRAFEYVGLSPHFHLNDVGNTVPEYHLKIRRENGELEVETERVKR